MNTDLNRIVATAYFKHDDGAGALMDLVHVLQYTPGMTVEDLVSEALSHQEYDPMAEWISKWGSARHARVLTEDCTDSKYYEPAMKIIEAVGSDVKTSIEKINEVVDSVKHFTDHQRILLGYFIASEFITHNDKTVWEIIPKSKVFSEIFSHEANKISLAAVQW